MQLLERESALASLAEYAGQARDGSGRLVVIAGEAGVGKSALVDQLRADVPDARWLWGACDGLFTPRPLGPLFDLAEQLGGELLERCQAGADRHELFMAVLRQVSQPGTLSIVIIEDVHWADEATADMLRFLGRRVRDAPVLLIVTYRDDGFKPDDPLRLALGDLATQRSTRRIDLPPLSVGAVRSLAAESPLDPSALHRLTGGNPFYVTAVLHSGMDVVPASARDAVLTRAARLSDKARAILDLAAAAGARVELLLLQQELKCPPDVLDELLTCGLVTVSDKWLRFRHEIARLAVQDVIAPHRLNDIHCRVLRGLRSLGCEDSARLAYHAEVAADATAVLLYAPAAAARATALSSHREAAAQYERALRFAQQADSATLARLHARLADELTLTDRPGDAAVAYRRALELWREAGDKISAGDTLNRLSCSLWSQCDGQEGHAVALAAVAELEQFGPTPELAGAHAGLAGSWMMLSDYKATITHARRAQSLAEALGLPAVLSDALNFEAVAVAQQGGDGIGLMNQALEIALAHCQEEQASRAYANLLCLHGYRRDVGAAEQCFVNAIAYCEEHDITTDAGLMRGEWALALLRAGRWDEASAVCIESLGSPGQSSFNRIDAMTALGTLLARRGQSGTWDHLDEALGLAVSLDDPHALAQIRLARAEANWLEGRSDKALREAELALAPGLCEEWVLGAIAIWLDVTGSEQVAHGMMAEPCRRQIAGDWRGAADAWIEVACPYDAALALLGSGDEAALREALSIFAGLGAAPAAAITRRRMRALGVRSIPVGPRTATRAGPAGLTRREQQVLGLLAAGHTNAEIAAALFLSAKTVDHHVSAILAKLGVSTRNAAIARAAELTLAGLPSRCVSL
jgi:DNA-binding CsgD family transcriptional regulator/tetratricopeptide (TPR) repeat protein